MTDPIVPSSSSEASDTGTAPALRGGASLRAPRGAPAFEAGAAKKQSGVILEFWDFLRHSRSWWLIPITIVVLLLGFALLVGTGPLAPLLYALF